MRLKAEQKMRLRVLAMAVLWCVAPAALAEKYTVLDRTIELTPPDNFCQLGKTARETALMEIQKNNTATAGVLTQFAVPCDELDAYRQGKVEGFSRWAQVMIVRLNGQLRPLEVSRDEFVRATAKNAASGPLDVDEVNRRLRKQLLQPETTVTVSGMQPIGVQDSAFFATMQLVAESNGEKLPTVAVVGVTVANRLPVVVQVYATSRASTDNLFETAASYVRNVVTKN